MTTAPLPVLVPLDGSAAAENAVPAALMLARHFDAPLRIVQVIDLASHEISAGGQIRAVEVFREYVDRLMQRHGCDPVTWTAEVVFGSPGPAIIDLAAKAAAVALASHGRGGFQTLFLGSVADKVVRGSRVPVLVVPAIGGPPATPSRIIVPVDGSPESARALTIARAIAGGLGAQITIVHAFTDALPPSPEYSNYGSGIIDELRNSAVAFTESLRRDGEEALVPYGQAADAIVRAARDRDADLVVMASTGKGLGGRLLLGSTTDRVLHTLHRPLLIIPPAGTDA